MAGYSDYHMQDMSGGGVHPPPVGLEAFGPQPYVQPAYGQPAYGQPAPPPSQNLYPNVADSQSPDNVKIGLEAPNEEVSNELGNKDGGNSDEIKGQTEEEPKTRDVDTLKTLYFRDGVRRIDYVLVYEYGKKEKNADEGDGESKKKAKRKEFEANLRDEHGLELEYEDERMSADGKTCFIKVHAPWQKLTEVAEGMKVKMPIQENDIENNDMEECCRRIPNPFELSNEFIPEEKDVFTCVFVQSRQTEYIGHEDHDKFFTPAERSRIVYEILERCKYDAENSKFGIEHMVGNGSYTAAFPLHEGNYTSEHSMLTHGAENDRRLLYEEWARPGRWYKYQPLDLVRKYFGEKIGIYFAWLGYYTCALFPAAIIGLLCFIYGCIAMSTNPVQLETCDKNGMGNTTMCPLCNEKCDYWLLYESCLYTQIVLLFDNYASVFFALVSSLWATLFMEFWKRKQFGIQYDWDLFGFEDHEENTRPEFEAKAPDTRINPVTKEEEPYVSFRARFPRFCATALVILFMLCLVLACVLGVIVYRIAVSSAIAATASGFVSSYSSIITTCTASVINLVLIMILNKIYEKIAVWLTDMEMHRTETEWEDSFTFKMYLFSFVNYYSSIFYIAFFKGQLTGYPGEYDTIFGFRVEECDPGGCLPELCLQLAIIMVGKQAYNNCQELLVPKFMNWCSARSAKKKEKEEGDVYSRWEQDYDLRLPNKHGLFDEYLEMVLQFGFVTLFVAAFSLAPLFALINNIIEIRLDAYKFTTQFRRPRAARAQDIGIWYGILDGVGKLSVVTNAFVIAITSEFVPRLVYIFRYSMDGSLTGYVNNSLSYFDTNDFEEGTAPEDTSCPWTDVGDCPICRYKDYRQPPWGMEPYARTLQHWHVLAARLAFVVVFEHVVFFLKWFIDYLIPDVPTKVKDEIKRENYLAKEAFYRAQLNQSKIKELKDGGGNGNAATVSV
uniref:Anoctamin n=1 Tax=Saccoglossus kowalevskii TaxID=10224 RepID=A0ABM0MSR6_SACKO|nr:PREDICTED: anoctamin-4-like [Saccoglossus kowalevskii]